MLLLTLLPLEWLVGLGNLSPFSCVPLCQLPPKISGNLGLVQRGSRGRLVSFSLLRARRESQFLGASTVVGFSLVADLEAGLDGRW